MDGSFLSEGLLSDQRGRLESKDLPSLQRLGRGLSGFVYETTWKENRYARKDFPIGAHEHNCIFEKEAKCLLDFDHPNIVKCYGYTLGRSSCSLLQEFVDDNIQDAIRRRTEARMKSANEASSSKMPRSRSIVPFEASEAVDVAAQIATGMEYLHRKEVARGDLKPKNVLVKTASLSASEASSSKMLRSRSIVPFEVSEAVDIASQIATGMEYLHRKEVAHGDLKPKNVLVNLKSDVIESGKMTVKVADYGFVQTKRQIKLVSKRARQFEGLMWKAPELFDELHLDSFDSDESDEDEEEVDEDQVQDEEVEGRGIKTSVTFSKSRLAVADVYSFGLTCAHILGGRLRYPELSLAELREQRMKGFTPELPGSNCPEYFKFIIDLCVEHNPLRRPTFSTICSMIDLFRSLPELFNVMKSAIKPDMMKVYGIADMISLTTSLRLKDCYEESIREFYKLMNLPCGIGKLTALKTLDVSGCSSLEQLPEEISNLASLTSLNMSGCLKLKVLSHGIGKLMALKTLDVSGCSSLEQLPEKIDNLTSLTSLGLSGCSKLKSLPHGINNLWALKTLDVSSCWRLEQLPEEISNLVSLTCLRLDRCSKLKVLPHGISKLMALKTLDVRLCWSLEQLPEHIGNLTSLTSLNLSGCSKLKSLPHGIGNLRALKTLDMSGCGRLEQLPKEIGNLTCLTSLNLSGCSKLKDLHYGIGNLKALETLDVSGCWRLEQLPKEICYLTTLTSLRLNRCERLKGLPHGIGNLRALRTLDVGFCLSLEQLPEEIGNMTSLTSLGFDGCLKLKDGIGHLKAVKTLDVSGYSSLEQLPGPKKRKI